MKIMFAFVATMLLAACSSTQEVRKVDCPGTVTRLDRFLPTVANTPEGFQASSVRMVSGDGTPSFGLGIKRDCQNKGEVFLMGESAGGNWSELLTVEPSTWNPLEVKVMNAWLGDFGNDGTPELLLHASLLSGIDAAKRYREFLVMASLGERVEYRFFFTLTLNGNWVGGCERGGHTYKADLDWDKPEEGKAPSAASYKWTLTDKVCPERCGTKKDGKCASASESGNGRFVWDQEQRAMKPAEGGSAVFIIPDVDFGPGFRRLPR